MNFSCVLKNIRIFFENQNQFSVPFPALLLVLVFKWRLEDYYTLDLK
jgi:hypothetical protein